MTYDMVVFLCTLCLLQHRNELERLAFCQCVAAQSVAQHSPDKRMKRWTSMQLRWRHLLWATTESLATTSLLQRLRPALRSLARGATGHERSG